jgi:hypothetical protein
MRPVPLAAGFHACLPGSVSRDTKSGCSANAKRDTLTAMPLEVSSFTKSRREVLTIPTLWNFMSAAARPDRAPRNGFGTTTKKLRTKKSSCAQRS